MSHPHEDNIELPDDLPDSSPILIRSNNIIVYEEAPVPICIITYDKKIECN